MPDTVPICEQPSATRHERWLAVELRHLAALEAIVREGSFRGAADSLSYVQSAVSQQIFHLEQLIGTRLIERGRGSAPLALTQAGEVLMQHVEIVLERFQEAQSDLVALREDRVDTLRVGVFQDVATRLLARVLPGFASLAPDIEVAPVESQSDASLFELVEEGDVELAFCQLPVPDGPFEHIELTDDPFVLLVAANSPLAESEDPPSLEEITKLRLIGLNESRAQEQVAERLAKCGTEPEFVLRSDLNTTLQALVAADLGVAIMPFLSVDPTHHGTTVIELPEIPPRKIALIWHRERERSQAAESFVTATIDACDRWFRHGDRATA